MTDPQWHDLVRVIRGERLVPLPVGLVVDSPWLPGWAGLSMLDYFGDDQLWLQANLRAAQRFERIWLLPGFWAEYGMCTEPSAFGASCIWYDDAFPNVRKVLHDYSEINRLKQANCRTDGMLPFAIRRLQCCRSAIEAAGHRIRFATARGPLNIASFLLGHTEFLIGLKTNPAEIHRLLEMITEFLIDWIGWQAETFDSIDGIFLLDDVIGFLRDDDFQEFALPYLKRVFGSRKVTAQFLHNDAMGSVTARHLATMDVNMFNFSFRHSLAEIRSVAGPSVVLLGNVPPRDVLAVGRPDDVRRCVADMLGPIDDDRRIIISCGGGMPPNAPSENIDALCAAVPVPLALSRRHRQHPTRVRQP
jgi:uroporphyrinogen-III decarboxylase